MKNDTRLEEAAKDCVQYRKEHGIPQAAMAQRLNCYQSQVSDLERGFYVPDRIIDALYELIDR